MANERVFRSIFETRAKNKFYSILLQKTDFFYFLFSIIHQVIYDVHKNRF